jgi:chromate reductase
MKASDGLLIITTEYNHSIPGVLKNTIDWLSRPAFKSCFQGKPFLFMTCSTSSHGGVRAQPHIREALVSTLAKPVIAKEVAIPFIDRKITGGKLTDADALAQATKAFDLLIASAQQG